MLVHLFFEQHHHQLALTFALCQTAIEFCHLYKPVISSNINHNIYVDDCLVSLPSVEKATFVYFNLTNLLARRGFHLTKWITSYEIVSNEIPEEESSTKALAISAR